ncbi:MAG: hypothetical protein VX498_07785, partial [Myxococcota bacterium]|nr:hypothetical protein [Myxococcota bacterium]
MGSKRLELLLGSAALLVTAGPLMLGLGVDVPDDALHHTVANWEWIHYAWSEGLNPHFVPGKLGGLSLAEDVVPMGPFYPAAWLLFLLPVHLALPLVAFGHALGILLAVRWLARTFGVGNTAATLAGTAIAAGPLGAITFIDCHLDVLPIYLWLPIAIGATERFCRSEPGPNRLRWALLCAAALALLLMGSHLRFSAAACAAWLLWALLRRMPLHWTLAVGVLATSGGSLGFLPNLLAVSEAGSGLSRLTALSGPVHETYNAWNLAGWIAPKPFWVNRDYSLGAVLGIALLLGFPALKGPIRRLGLFAALLILAALSPSIWNLRYVFAPLLIFSHPLDLIYGALAMLPAAVAAAAALEALCRRKPGRVLIPASRLAGVTLLLLVGGMFLRAVLQNQSLLETEEWQAWLLGILQAVLVLVALFFILQGQDRSPGKLLRLVFLLALLDLSLLGVRYHLAVPSGDLNLAERAEASDLEDLGASYLDITDLADLEGFLYGLDQMEEVPQESQTPLARRVNANLANRRWPLHVGPGHGIPALSGKAKMPNQRSIHLLMPLSEALVQEDGNIRNKLEQSAPEQVEALFAPDQLGGRILRLTGTEVAVDRSRVVGRVQDPLPACWNPETYVVLEGTDKPAMLRAWERVVLGGLDPLESAVLEAPIDLPKDLPRATVSCDGTRISVDADEETLIVLLRPWLAGWRLVSENGSSPALVPADAFHIAFVAPAGSHRFDLHFDPPGLQTAQLASGISWLLLVGGLLLPRVRAFR